MNRWIKTLYDNQSILDYRNLRFYITVPLFLLTVLFLCVPLYIGLYTVNAEGLLKDMSGFESGFIKYIENTDCTIDGQFYCTGVSENSAKVIDGYTFIYLPAESSQTTGNNIMAFTQDLVSISDNQGNLVIGGGYENFGKLSFKALSADFRSGNIDSHEFVLNFMRSVSLSLFAEKMILQYVLLFIQNLTYLLVLAGLFLFVSIRKPRPFNYRQSLTMMVHLMFGPALLSAVLGIFNPALASVGFSAFLILRIVWLYQALLRKRVTFEAQATEAPDTKTA